MSRTICLSDTHAASWNFPLLFPHLNTDWNTNKNLCYNILAEHFCGTQSVSCEATARHLTQNTSNRHTYTSSWQTA